MNLKSTQHSFIEQLIHTQSADNFLNILSPCGELSTEQQLAIYQNNVRGALQNTLAQIYPICCKILGDKYFKQLAHLYITNHPSRHYDLNQYGDLFADFLHSHCQHQNELNNYLYLSDLAKLEWFYQQIYYAADASTFDFSAFAQLTEKQQTQSVFNLSPCIEFICSDYPIHSIWLANQAKGNEQQYVKYQAENICIFRQNNQIQILLIDKKTTELLTIIKQDLTLEAMSKAGYGNQLTELIQRGWIDGFKITNV